MVSSSSVGSSGSSSSSSSSSQPNLLKGKERECFI